MNYNKENKSECEQTITKGFEQYSSTFRNNNSKSVIFNDDFDKPTSPPGLFDPITLEGITFRNRIWVAPMCQYSAVTKDGVANAWHRVHYGSLSSGGAGAVTIEATGVRPEGRISNHCLGLWNEEQVKAFRPLIDFAHWQGVPIGIQLVHAGRKASTHPQWYSPSRLYQLPSDGCVAALQDYTSSRTEGNLNDEEGWSTYGPSPISFPGLKSPQELTLNQIQEVIDSFVYSTKLAHQAGFDFVQLHGAHGYLLYQFLSPLSNRRDDKYGGELENRCRLLLEVFSRVREVFPSNLPVMARLSASDWVEDGFNVAETIEVVTMLGKLGVSLVDISSGGNITTSIPAVAGYQSTFAARVKQATNVPTSTVGLITQVSQAQHILSTNQADVIHLGRALLRNPYLPLQWAKEQGLNPSYIPGQYTRAWR